MLVFMIQIIIWTLILYTIYEIARIIICYFEIPSKNQKDTYIMVVKNSEEYIEGFLRSLIFKILYGKEKQIKQILIIDLDSKDKTIDIVNRMMMDYGYIKLIEIRDNSDYNFKLEEESVNSP